VHDLGQLFLAAILVTGPLLLLRGTVARAAASHSGNGRIARTARSASQLTSPRHIRAEGKARAATVWETARAADWLEARRHDRAQLAEGRPQAGPRPYPPDIPGDWHRDSPGSPWYQVIQGRKVAEPEVRQMAADADDPRGLKDAPWTGARPPQPHSQPASNGGPATMAAGTSTASAEKLIEGINEIHAHAATGNIHRKREATRAGHEGAVRFAAMLAMLARMMAEPGSNYGPEITEPLARASQHCQAAAMSISESDAALTSLLNMRVAELADSTRQAPHHAELTETGGH